MVRKILRVAFLCLLLFVVVVFLGSAVFIYTLPDRYTGFIIEHDPLILVLVKPTPQKIVVLTIPADTYIEGIHGYGKYSLSSLWKLGFIDKLGGMLLAESLAETLGVPITGFVGFSSSAAGESPISVLKSTFTWKHALTQAFMRIPTNIGFAEFVSITKRLQNTGDGDVRLLDIAKTTLLQKVSLADGGAAREVDEERIDPIIGNAFEDEDVRGEGRRIAIFNTTGTSGLGSKVGKMISHIGGVVVSVTNAPELIDRCTIEASKDAINSKTAAFIRTYYHCETKISEDTLRADIIVRIGTRYASRFMPLK